jgi:coenzyme F420 hydrogenase subunit beta
MTGASATLAQVNRGRLCTGCGLCEAVSNGAIRMEEVEPGFNRPIQHGPVDAQTDALIADCCPGAVVAPWPGAPNVHPYWGPWRQVSVGHATDPLLRHRASSGGALSALLVHALRSGLVDRVIQIAADPDQPTGNIVVCSTTEGEIAAAAGSRYAASSPLAAIRQVLAEGGQAAFVGKPCDVSALRRYARWDERVEKHIPFALSFFCAGVPARRGADKILDAMGVERSQLAAFRYRGEGWPGRAAARLRDGSVREMSYEQSWGGYLADEVQFRCKICPDGVGGVADVACADAWYGGESGYPSFEDRDGRSLVISRTAAGAALVAGAVSAGALELAPLDIEKIELMQPSQAQRKRNVRVRTAALGVALQPRPKMRQVFVEQASKKARPAEVARNFVGTIRRVMFRRP